MIIYIINIGITIVILYFLNKYLKNYIPSINSLYNLIFFKKEILKTDKINTIDRVEIIKDKYGIKSTEKTNVNVNLKFVVKKPNHLKINIINNVDVNINNKQLKYFKNRNKNIIKSYIYNKKKFMELFLSDENLYIIKNLETFYIFHKNNLKSETKFNILLKFYNDFEYLYIYVNNNNLIKIINDKEYDIITNLIENNNNIFLIQESPNINYICYGGYTNCELKKNDIKKIFFNNSTKLNKNFEKLKKFKNLNIFFYVSTLIN